MNVSLAFVEQGIGRAWGGLFARAKSAAAELKFPLLNSLSPSAKSSDVCEDAVMVQTQAARNKTNTRILSSAAPPAFSYQRGDPLGSSICRI